MIILDEVQKMPELFPVLRALIDRKKKNGRFLLLGSASPSGRASARLSNYRAKGAQPLNTSTLAKSLGLSPPTINHYIEIFEGTFILRSLLPYHANIKKRLVKSPKIYFRDTGILHTLLDIETYDALQSNPYVGHSWEAFVIEQVVAQMPTKLSPYFYRTAAGSEIDLILKAENSAPIAVEIKYSLSPALSRGFYQGYQDLGCKKGVVIYPGKDMYKIAKNITALPINRLGELF